MVPNLLSTRCRIGSQFSAEVELVVERVTTSTKEFCELVHLTIKFKSYFSTTCFHTTFQCFTKSSSAVAENCTFGLIALIQKFCSDK